MHCQTGKKMFLSTEKAFCVAVLIDKTGKLLKMYRNKAGKPILSLEICSKA